MQIDNILIKTSNGNSYYFDEHYNQVLFIHPQLAEIIKSNISANSPKKNKNENEYYLKKYKFLKQHNYFSENETSGYKNAFLKEEHIDYLLANLDNIVFEVTEKCNLACKYCAYGNLYVSSLHREQRDLQYENIVTLISHLKNYWESHLNQSYNRVIDVGFYGGEPLINFQLIKKVVEYTKQIENDLYRFSYHLTSNGLLLNKHIDYLIENNFHLGISLDGDADNNSFRVFKNGKESFKRVFTNLKFVQEKDPDFFNSNINLLAVLHSKNNISSVYDFFLKHFNKTPRIGEVNSYGILENERDNFEKIYINYYQVLKEDTNSQSYQKIYYYDFPSGQLLTNFVEKYSGYVINNYVDPLIRPIKNEIPTGTCLPFQRKLYLNAHGEIFPCERISRNYKLGYVYNGGVKLDTKEIADLYNAFFKIANKKCRNCYTSKLCGMCIFYLNPDMGSIKCKDFMGTNKIKKLVSSLINTVEDSPNRYTEIMSKIYFR